MIKRMFRFIIALLCLNTFAFAQGTFVPSLVRLRDDSSPSHQLIVKSDGSYLLLMGLDSLRIESFANLQKKGCTVSFSETTEWYRVVVMADVCQGTGKAVVNYFGLGTFTVLDRRVD
jgi:hypothetical protein